MNGSNELIAAMLTAAAIQAAGPKADPDAVYERLEDVHRTYQDALDLVAKKEPQQGEQPRPAEQEQRPQRQQRGRPR